jgi:hypothetical protein
MPEQHGKYARHTEHQRKGEKIPLLAQKVYVWISKKFHAFVRPLSTYSICRLPLRLLLFLGDLCGQKLLPQSAQKKPQRTQKQPGLLAPA